MNNKKILKAIIVLLVLIVAIVLALIILKNPTENNNTTNEGENLGQQEEKEVIRLGQSFSAKAGTYIIVKEGNVYYIPNYSITNAQELEQTQGVATYGYYNTKEVYIADPMPENEKDLGSFYGYKLNLENIKLGYKFNTENEEHIIFVDATGNVSELSYKIVTANEEDSDNVQLANIKLTKNISNYKNIVNVINTSNADGEYIKLIDTNGNQYAYYGAENAEKNVTEQAGQCFTDTAGTIDDGYMNVVVSSNGDVYLNVNTQNNKIDLSSCGVKGSYTNVLPNTTETNNFEGYKLNVTNITAAYSFNFGNSTNSYSLLMLDKDGNITELVITSETDGTKTKMEKNTQFSNIVTVVEKMYTGAHGAIVVDENGNEYYYSSIAN